MNTLQSNFIMAPVKLGYSDGSGRVTPRHLDFYKRRNRHIGAIIPEPFYLDAGLRELPSQMGIDSDDKLEGLQSLTAVIKEHGTLAIAHLNHPGRMSNPMIPGNYQWSSTAKACENGGKEPQKMDRAMMDHVLQLFVDSAQRAAKAGFDMLELQLGHGYLLAQFLSPAVNDRDDEYGGSRENRFRFPIEVVRAVLRTVSLPVGVRISGDEMLSGGLHIDEMSELALRLQAEGVAFIHVSAGSVCSTPPWFFQHMFIPKGKTWELAGLIRQKVDIPVVFVGKINSPADVQYITEHYDGEYFALGRALVADPDFVKKYLHKDEGLIRPCLACAEGCLGGVKSGKGLACVVNPRVNTGLAEVVKAPDSKRFAVVGGGLAGMEAALTLAQRGYAVELFEKEKLGGQFNLAYLPPNKQSLKALVDYFVQEISHSEKIKVHHREADAAVLKEGSFDGVIMATGAVPAIPAIEGLKEYYWTEFLQDEQLPQKEKVLVVGGGLIGLEVASKLVDNDNEVLIVEMLDEIARGMEMIEKTLTLKKLKAHGVQIFTGHRVVAVQDGIARLQGPEGEREIAGIGKTVVAVGMKPYVPFTPDSGVPVYTVGDARRVAKAQDAIRDAYELALQL